MSGVLDSYAAVDDDDRVGAQPGEEPAYQQVEKVRRDLRVAETARDARLLAASSPQPGTSVVLTSELVNTFNAAETALDAALDELCVRRRSRIHRGDDRHGGGSAGVAALAETMNAMLERIETGHNAQRRFVGDASHELRSPLATLQPR